MNGYKYIEPNVKSAWKEVTHEQILAAGWVTAEWVKLFGAGMKTNSVKFARSCW